MRNRFLAVGLVLSLSISFGGQGRATAQVFDPEICRAVPEVWRLPCACFAVTGGDEDLITATEESPLVAERSIARDPWSILQDTPGVLVDRINVGGRESSCSSRSPVVEVTAAVGQGFPGVDEMIATPMAAAGSLPNELDFNAFAEIPVETLDAGAPGTPEPLARLRPRHGTNEWTAMGFFQGSRGGQGDGEGDRLDSLRAANAWMGGPLAKDRFWTWGEAGLHQVDRIVLARTARGAGRPQRPLEAQRPDRERRLRPPGREPRPLHGLRHRRGTRPRAGDHLGGGRPGGRLGGRGHRHLLQ